MQPARRQVSLNCHRPHSDMEEHQQHRFGSSFVPTGSFLIGEGCLVFPCGYVCSHSKENHKPGSSKSLLEQKQACVKRDRQRCRSNMRNNNFLPFCSNLYSSGGHHCGWSEPKIRHVHSLPSCSALSLISLSNLPFISTNWLVLIP